MVVEVFTAAGLWYRFPDAKVDEEQKDTITITYVDVMGKERVAIFYKSQIAGYSKEV